MTTDRCKHTVASMKRSRIAINVLAAKYAGVILLLLLLSPAVAVGESALQVRDPNASFLDVQVRRKALENAQTPRLRAALLGMKTCTGAALPAPPPRGQDIPSRYESGSHGKVNSQEHTLSEPYYRVQDVAAWGANRYLVTGDPKEAICVINALLPWAQSRTLLDYNAKDDMVVWFQSTWTVASLSLSVSVIRAEPALNSADRNHIITWLREAAHKAMSETRGPHSATANNNHFFWRGLAATAAGVISKDDALFAEELRTYATAVAEIDSQGAFPAEMSRHELALHYQAFAIEPLVMIAELAQRQGINLYDLEENGHRLRDAIAFLSKAMADSSIVKKYTPETQQTAPDLQPGSQLLAWVEFWNIHATDSLWSSVLEKPLYTARLSGSATLYAAPIIEKPKAAVPLEGAK